MLRPALLLLCCTPAAGADLFDGFAEGWRGHWREQRFLAKPTHYEVTRLDGAPVLHATARSANAGLYRAHKLAAPVHARLAWRWKIAAPLTGNTRERERAGDDYAARSACSGATPACSCASSPALRRTRSPPNTARASVPLADHVTRARGAATAGWARLASAARASRVTKIVTAIVASSPTP